MYWQVSVQKRVWSKQKFEYDVLAPSSNRHQIPDDATGNPLVKIRFKTQGLMIKFFSFD
jgi:hypothetical protein